MQNTLYCTTQPTDTITTTQSFFTSNEIFSWCDYTYTYIGHWGPCTLHVNIKPARGGRWFHTRSPPVLGIHLVIGPCYCPVHSSSLVIQTSPFCLCKNPKISHRTRSNNALWHIFSPLRPFHVKYLRINNQQKLLCDSKSSTYYHNPPTNRGRRSITRFHQEPLPTLEA